MRVQPAVRMCHASVKGRRKKDPINTKNLTREHFIIRLAPFLKTVNMMNLFASEFMKIDDSLCGCFNWVCLVV